jgi:hypothetical protein
VIEPLHPFVIGVVVACMPVATIAVSASIDYFSHRHQKQRTAIARPAEPGTIAQLPVRSGNVRALPVATRIPATHRKS